MIESSTAFLVVCKYRQNNIVDDAKMLKTLNLRIRIVGKRKSMMAENVGFLFNVYSIRKKADKFTKNAKAINIKIGRII